MSGFFISFEAITNYDLSACFENFPTNNKRSGKKNFSKLSKGKTSEK